MSSESISGEIRSLARAPSVEIDAGLVAGDLDTSDTTAVVPRTRVLASVAVRLKSLHAWGFVIVATVAFSVVYVGMQLAPVAARSEIRAPAVSASPTPKFSGPLVVRLATPVGATQRDAVGDAAFIESPGDLFQGRAAPVRTRPRAIARSTVRGEGLSVDEGALSVAVVLDHPERDARFTVRAAPSWPTSLAVVGKSATGFTVSFDLPAPAGARVDWLLSR